MNKKADLQTCNLDFMKGTIYKDKRSLGENAFRDIKLSLMLGTAADLVHYLKKGSTLLKDFSGNEMVEDLFKGTFSVVYVTKDNNGKKLVIKRSHDGWLPLQFGKNFYVNIPRWFAKLFFADYDITEKSLQRDVYDYEKIVKPFWGKSRVKFTGEKFTPYLNMALHMDDHFLPEFEVEDIYTKKFWDKLLSRKRHKNLSAIRKYLRSVTEQDSLIPKEERFVLYDGFTNSLQTIFIQEAMFGEEELIPDRRMVFPFEMISNGVVPEEMPKLMLEHLLRTAESFVNQIDNDVPLKKVPDFRPLESWKVFPPTPYELFIAETNNLVVCKKKRDMIDVSLVDTHLLMEPEGNLIYRWTEKRYWVSLFMNIRFWVRKALSMIEEDQ